MVCMFQWLWSLLPYIPGLLKLVEPKNVPVPVVPVPAGEVLAGHPSIWLIIFAVIITAGFVAISIYLFIKLPSMTYKTSQKLVVGTAKRLTPVARQGVKLSPKKRWQLTEQIIFYIKLSVCILPVVGVGFSYYIDTQIDFTVTIFVAAVMAMTAAVLLGLQVLLSGWLGVSVDQGEAKN